MTLPEIIQHDSPTLKEIRIGDLDIFYSYTTPVAYRYPGKGLRVAKNIWSNTTGRHLNMIGGQKEDRINHADLLAELRELTSALTA